MPVRYRWYENVLVIFAPAIHTTSIAGKTLDAALALRKGRTNLVVTGTEMLAAEGLPKGLHFRVVWHIRRSRNVLRRSMNQLRSTRCS